LLSRLKEPPLRNAVSRKLSDCLIEQSAKAPFAPAEGSKCLPILQEEHTQMQFHFIPKPVNEDIWTAGFTLDQVWADDAGLSQDISHLLDRTYMYHSARELQWHLADRFGLAPHRVEVTSRA
jgi:hypothetical protein